MGAVNRRRGFLAALAAIAALAILSETYVLTHRSALSRLEVEARASAHVRALALESELAKQRAVVAILADDGQVAAAVQAGAATVDVSRKLDRLRDETQGSVIYLLDHRGVAIAASNWDEPVSFVGSNYSFRRYFTGALENGTAQQFALGTVSHKAGLYLSHVVPGPEPGVVVVKVEFGALEASWAASAEPTYVTDAEGRIMLSSRPDRRFALLPPTPPRMIATEVEIPGAGWRLTLHSSSVPAAQTAVLATMALALALMALAVGAGLVWRGKAQAEAREAEERRYRADLEREVAARTRDLSAEVRERQAAETRLVSLQADLVQANKLATLGQVTAGVAHEVNQPLATIRLLTENARMMLPAAIPPELDGNLDTILRMTDRLGRITTELRGFSRKARGHVEPTPLAEAFEASLLLTASRQRASAARLIRPEIPPGLMVMAEAVRLEQVLVNLLQNAHEALAGHPDPEIRVTLTEGAETVTLTVADNGPGLPPEVARQLFTPFTTTKPQGLGLGLVIAQDIMRDFGGSLRADPPEPGQGARFHLELRKVAA